MEQVPMCKTLSTRKFLIATLLFCLAAVGSAMADPVVFSGGASYAGGNFNISATNNGSNSYIIKYTADFTKWTGGSLYLSGIDFKFGSIDETAGNIVSTTAAGVWTLNDPSGSLTGGKIGTNGCQTATGATFVCVDGSPFNANPTSGTYEWVFNITYQSPLSAADFSNNHIGALFVNSAGSSRGILSTGMTSSTNNVPEPMSAALLGVGILGLGFRRYLS
jgi:hypothetical protein